MCLCRYYFCRLVDMSLSVLTDSSRISWIVMEMSDIRSSVCLTSTTMSESSPKSPRVVAGFTVSGSVMPTMNKRKHNIQVTHDLTR